MIPELIGLVRTQVSQNYPHLLEDADIDGVMLWDVKNNKEVPGLTLEASKLYVKINKLTDVAVITIFNNNIIGYRLIK
jgi:hypothetical protein